MQIPTVAAGPAAPHPADRDVTLRAAAVKLEATFLAEMLKSAGLGETAGTFGGGAGEEQFTSFLRDAQAGKIAESGGLGLAESIYRSLLARR